MFFIRKKVILRGGQDGKYKKRKFENVVRLIHYLTVFNRMNAFGMLPVVIIKTKAESLCL